MERVLVVLICLTLFSSWVVSETKNVTNCENAKKIYKNAGYNDDGIYSTGQQGKISWNKENICLLQFLIIYFS